MPPLYLVFRFNFLLLNEPFWGKKLNNLLLFLQAIDAGEGQTTVQATTLRTNRNYVVYYNFWTKTLLTEMFPYVTLIVLNACIYREIRRSVKRQQAMRCTQPQKEEIKSANVVVRYTYILEIHATPLDFCFLKIIVLKETNITGPSV